MNNYIGKRIHYEWDMETLCEEHGVIDHDHHSVGDLERFVSAYLNYWDYDDELIYSFDLVLVQDFWTEDEGRIHREWYYLDTCTLEFNPPLPAKYLQKEFEKSLPTIRKLQFKKPIK